MVDADLVGDVNLVASVICRNEWGRYLPFVIPHLLSFVDEVRIVDDGSDDDTSEWLLDYGASTGRVAVRRNTQSVFDVDEGTARHQCFEWTLAGKPTHILAIDCDEFVSDGAALRLAVEADPGVPVWTLLVCEVWEAALESLWIRMDQDWLPARAPILYRAPEAVSNVWRIPSRKLASGREPTGVVMEYVAGNRIDMPVDLLHFGWANASERKARYLRYAEGDAGEFHSGPHIESILDEDVHLEALAWPGSLNREALSARVNKVLAPTS